jgi:hypothetical protein
VTFYAGETSLDAAQPLPALEPGQSAEVSAPWTRPEPGVYQFSALVNEPQVEVLCATPPMGRTWVGLAQPTPQMWMPLIVR